jgi:hypothetical protein
VVIVSPPSTSYSASALTHHESCRSLQRHGLPRNSLPRFQRPRSPVIRSASWSCSPYPATGPASTPRGAGTCPSALLGGYTHPPPSHREPTGDVTTQRRVHDQLSEFDFTARPTVDGQALQLGWQHDGCAELTADDYLELIMKKTCWYTTVRPVFELAGLVGSTGWGLRIAALFGLRPSVARSWFARRRRRCERWWRFC